MRNLRKHVIAGLAMTLTLGVSPPAAFAGHGGSASPELEVVGTFPVPHEGLTTDVWAYGNFAYIGSFDVIDGTDQCSLDLTGVRVIDISDPTDPSLASFIPARPGTRNNDVKVEHIETPHFNGEILVASNEPCEAPFMPRTQSNGKGVVAGRGGISIWDVTDPTKPKAMKQSFMTNGIHNTFIWQDGSNAYLIAVDDVATRDVVVVDITKPQSPKVIARVGAPDWPDLDFGEIEGPSLFLHDVWVQDGIAYLSYWDAGLVLLDVSDVANPVFLGDSTYPNPDVVSGLPPEGNGHVSAPTADGLLTILGDEDFSKFSAVVNTSAGTFKIGVALFGPDPLTTYPAGDVVWTGGEGCSSGAIPPADAFDPDPQIALIQRGTCFFSEKALNAEQQGYDAYIVANNAAGGEGIINMSAGTDDPVTIPGIFVGFSAGEALKAPGTTVLSVDSIFDGEGFMRVLDVTDPENIVQIGHFATEGVFSLGEIPEDRTAHNVIVRGETAYWSWYWEGIRVVDFSDCDPGDGFEGCTPTEVAHFVDTGDHSNFWGVYLHDHPDGNTYILGSDRDSGLWIFADPLS
jgi:hypothetical protein